MAERLLGDILGQSSNATSGGLLGGPSIFQTQPSRGQRRSALLSQAISSQGSNPYARLGAAFGGLIGMGGRAAGEGLGILQEPEQVRQSRLIREAQQAAAESGIDPVAEPERFLEVIDPIVESDPLLKSGIRSQIVRLQRELAPEPVETEKVIRGGTPEGDAAGLSEGESAIGTYVNGERTALKNRKIVEPDELKVGATGRFKRKNSDEVVTLVRTDRGLAEQVVGEDGQPTFNYVNSSDYEQVSRQQTDSRESVTPTETQLRPYAAVISSNKNLNDKIKSFVEDAPEATLLGLNIPFTGGRDQDAVDAVSLQAQQRAAEIRSDNAELTIEQALEQAIDELSQSRGEPTPESNTSGSGAGSATPENDPYAGRVNP